MAPVRRAVFGCAAVGVLAWGTWAYLTRPHLPAAERGRRLADDLGCFACHGADGLGGTANPGRTDGEVPNFSGDVMMYAHDADDIRAWIADGTTAARASSESWQQQRTAGTLVMPRFGDTLTDAQLDDLVAYVRAASGDPAPPDGAPSLGRDRANALGCFGCHGAGGRLARPNGGSLKRYIPSWDGDDFGELVADRAEFDGWVRDGVCARLGANFAARFFLDRAVVHMPAFRGHLEPGDLDALWAYVGWVRGAAG